MIKLEVKDNKIHTEIKSDNSKYPIPQQIAEGVAELFGVFEAELIMQGNTEEEVTTAVTNMLETIIKHNKEIVSKKLEEQTNISS